MSTQRGMGFRGIGRASVLAAAVGLLLAACSDSESGAEPARPQKLLILHTNDLHSHLMGHSPEADYTPATTGDDLTRGGVARLAGEIASARERAAGEQQSVLLLDAGDFMMGTLFELLGTTRAPELSVMQSLGYDATTIGNHELDWSPAGLAAILNAAAEQGVHVPILASNMKFSSSDPGDDELADLAEAGVIQSKLIKTVGSLKVGFFGLLGQDAVQVSPQAAPLTFDMIGAAATRMVKELREEDGVDLVIALSHSGINQDGSGEDAELAKNVSGIDVIVSGHTHEWLTEPKRVNDTLIVTAGSYGHYLGELQLTVTPAAKPGERASVELDGYELRDIDDSIEGDAAIQSKVEGYISDVDDILASSQLSYQGVVATTEADLPLADHAESPIGNLVADAYRTLAAELEPDEPAVIGVDANGSIRSEVSRGETGEVWLADLFRVVPLGIGFDQQPGLPLVSFYLNAADIRSGLELGAGKDAIPNDYFLQVSGLKVEYDTSKPLFSRVTRLALVGEEGEQELDPSDTKTCYKIVTTNYVAGLLGVVERFTAGLLAVNAKDADCETLIDPTERFIDADPERDGVQELKQWQALLRYVSALPDSDDDGIPNIPLSYAEPQERIVWK